MTVAWGWTVPKTVEVPQLQSVQFLERLLTRPLFATTGACAGPDSAEIRGVSARVLGLGSLPVVVQRQVPGWSRQCSKLWRLRSWRSSTGLTF